LENFFINYLGTRKKKHLASKKSKIKKKKNFKKLLESNLLVIYITVQKGTLLPITFMWYPVMNGHLQVLITSSSQKMKT